MFGRIMPRMSAGALGVLFALSFFGGANATAISPSTTNNFITGGEDYTAVSGLNTGVAIDAAPLGFDHTYTFDVQLSSLPIASSMDVIQEPPRLDQGIADLKYVWKEGATTILTLLVTNSAGFRCDGSNGCAEVGTLPFLFSHVFSTGLFTVQVTGVTLDSGGDYSLVLTAVPLPAAALLFGSVLLGGGLMRRRKMIKEFGLPA